MGERSGGGELKFGCRSEVLSRRMSRATSNDGARANLEVPNRLGGSLSDFSLAVLQTQNRLEKNWEAGIDY